MMSPGAKLNLARQSDHAQPVWCVHPSPEPAPKRLKILQLKGFAGGVPLNTETAAVKPRAGIMNAPGPLNFCRRLNQQRRRAIMMQNDKASVRQPIEGKCSEGRKSGAIRKTYRESGPCFSRRKWTSGCRPPCVKLHGVDLATVAAGRSGGPDLQACWSIY